LEAAARGDRGPSICLGGVQVPRYVGEGEGAVPFRSV